MLAIEDGEDSQRTHQIYIPSHWEVETTTEKSVADDRGTEGHIGAREGQGPEHGTRSIWGLKAGKRCPDVGEKSRGYDAPELLTRSAAPCSGYR